MKGRRCIGTVLSPDEQGKTTCYVVFNTLINAPVMPRPTSRKRPDTACSIRLSLLCPDHQVREIEEPSLLCPVLRWSSGKPFSTVLYGF